MNASRSHAATGFAASFAFPFVRETGEFAAQPRDLAANVFKFAHRRGRNAVDGGGRSGVGRGRPLFWGSESLLGLRLRF